MMENSVCNECAAEPVCYQDPDSCDKATRKSRTNNPNGRPKGTPNKITTDMRGWLTAVIDKNRKQMEKDLKRLEPKDRLQILEKLMQYVIPKQQAVSADIDFGRLTDEQLDAVIDQLTKDIGDEN